MNENDESFDENELTIEDLDILKAFDAIENWPAGDKASSSTPGTFSVAAQHLSDADKEQDEVIEMLMIFLEEAGEDIGKMRQACNQIAQNPQPLPARFAVFQRAGHKLRGTAGAVGYPITSTAAEHIETIAERVLTKKIEPDAGFKAIEKTVSVLEHCHQYLSEEAKEPADATLIPALEAFYSDLGIQIIHQSSPTTPSTLEENTPKSKITKHLTVPTPLSAAEYEQKTLATGTPSTQAEASSVNSFMHIETRRFENLLRHTENLVELHVSLENAQKEVKVALQAQSAAQTRLQQLEQALSELLLEKRPPKTEQNQTSSSLIARILNAAEHTPSHIRKKKNHSKQQSDQQKEVWDELDMEHYTEKDLLLRALREAIVQQSVCTTRVNTVSSALQQLQQEYMSRVALVRSDTQLMRLTPLSTLVPKLQKVIAASALAQHFPVQLDVSGENLEIDQEILEALTPSLLEMLDICTSDTSVIKEEQQKKCHVGFHARSNGNDITIEIGFSMPVLGGAFEILQKPLQKLNGSITLQRNPSGWVSFYLSIPRSQGTAPCLIIRVEDQQYIVPMVQIQRVHQQAQEQLTQSYDLRGLLELPSSITADTTKNCSKPLLVIQSAASNKSIGIIVDEIIGEQELILKPLPAFMQRPGITEFALDGQGNVLLLIDIPELIAKHISNESQEETISSQQLQPINTVPKILLADDSAYLRQRVLQALQREHYEVVEAKDGMEAVEQLLENTPDIFLLDIEMPNLNGYDVLNVIREYPELARVKTIMLTSRTSEKHKLRAQELGALAYLPKPCPQDILLKTISELLAQTSRKPLTS
jgi:chemosensory pili system protein ChpA (sensor histidine kinase/response regulator)